VIPSAEHLAFWLAAHQTIYAKLGEKISRSAMIVDSEKKTVALHEGIG
jgi:hypothetical protein